MKIYLASSWRNAYQAAALAALRSTGLEVYDFKNPAPAGAGFGWNQCDPGLVDDLTVERMRRVLAHPVACAGFKSDMDAMKWADACVLLLPSGMSTHLEAGWFAGAGKPVAILAPEIREPELMYKMFDSRDAWGRRGSYSIPINDWETPLFATVDEVVVYLGGVR